MANTSFIFHDDFTRVPILKDIFKLPLQDSQHSRRCRDKLIGPEGGQVFFFTKRDSFLKSLDAAHGISTSPWQARARSPCAYKSDCDSLHPCLRLLFSAKLPSSLPGTS